MGYLSCRAESSISTCRTIAAVSPSQSPTNRKKQSDPNKSEQNQENDKEENDDEDKSRGRRIEHFTYAELESATNNFSDSSLLGRGSHGAVYKANLPRTHHAVVAVKRPSHRPAPAALSTSTSSEVENEIEILSKIHSPRLVNLIGFTPKFPHLQQQRHQRLLVVEFMPNGTLYDYLHSNPRPPTWPRRLRLALQTSKALLTLHSARPPVIHRDVKSANILIDRSFNARLGDFGLALRLDDAAFPSSCRSTPPAGTLGYLDPCYVTPENLSTKTDVFSFGILLLEIMSGRKAIDVAYSPPSVVEWAVPLLRKGKVGAIYDPRISPPKDAKVRRQLAVLAASCVRSSDERRPSMEEVVEQLNVLSKAASAAAKAWNGLSVVNPCSVVETEGTLLKAKAGSNGTNLSKESSVGVDAKIVEETTGRREEEMRVVGVKKPPLPVSGNASVKAIRLLRNENLMELLAQPDEDDVELRGGRRMRTLHITSDYHGKGGTLKLQKNQIAKGPQFESSVKLDGHKNSDGRHHS